MGARALGPLLNRRGSEQRRRGEDQMREQPLQIGPYKILRRLGIGGMGEVFAAVDQNLGRLVALKRVRADAKATPSRRQRFLREARLAARLNHPSIVQIYSLLEEGDELYIVMEHVSGTTLRQRLHSEGPLPPSELMRIAKALAEGLREAHRQGVIHRDLKTENVLLGDSGAIKMADFGIARPFSEEMEESITKTEALVGTYRTMSPEQARGERLDHRSDLFSMGVLLYEAATGRSPFPAENNLATLNQIITRRQVPANEIRAELPLEISRVIDHLLEKHPELRPQSADELLTLLDSANLSTPDQASVSTLTDRSGTGAIATPTGQMEPTREKNRTAARTRTLWLGLAIPLLAVVAGLLYILREPPRPLFVAVPSPHVEPANFPLASSLVAPAVRFGLTNGLLSLRGISVLASDEVDEAAKLSTGLASSTAADEILSATLSCRPQSCRITLRRLNGRDGTVVSSQLFDVPTDDLQVLTSAVLSFVRTAYPGFPNKGDAPLDVRAGDYMEFLRLEKAFREKDRTLSADQLLAALDSIQRSSPRFPSAYRLAADILRYRFHDSRDSEDLEKAVGLLQQAAKLAPNSVQPVEYLFLTALAANRLDTAEEALARIERLEPGGYVASKLNALLLERRGATQEALQSMRAAAERLPSARMIRILADMEFRLGRALEARQTIKRAIAIAPEFRSRELLARIELLNGDPAEAAKLFADLDQQTTDFGIASNLGLSLFLLGRYPEASDSFEKALRLAPRNAGANLNLADARLLAGRGEEARRLYRQVVALIEEDPAVNSSHLLTVKGQALAHLRLDKEAVASVSEALRQSPDNPQTLFEASLVYTLVGDKTSALVNAERALRLGCDRRWFDFAWFDAVRSDPPFQKLLDTKRPPG